MSTTCIDVMVKTRSGRVAQNTVQPLPVQQASRSSTPIVAPVDNGRHVRFASKDQFVSPPPDQDGDSVMGDSEYVPSEGGVNYDKDMVDENSDEAVNGDNIDTTMGDDSVAEIDVNEGPQTPTRAHPYDAGSVLLTPNKNRPHASGHGQAFGNVDTGVNARYPSIDENRFNHTKYMTFSPANRAYVLVPPSQRTPGRRIADENAPGPSNRPVTPPARYQPPPSLRRQRIEVRVEPLITLGPLSMENPVRWYRGENGAFVRDGSLPPDYYGAEHLKKVQPPRAEPVPQPAKLVRHDTEPLEDDPAPPKVMVPGAQPPARSKGKAKAKARARAETDVQMLRRSIRIRELKK